MPVFYYNINNTYFYSFSHQEIKEKDLKEFIKENEDFIKENLEKFGNLKILPEYQSFLKEQQEKVHAQTVNIKPNTQLIHPEFEEPLKENPPFKYDHHYFQPQNNVPLPIMQKIILNKQPTHQISNREMKILGNYPKIPNNSMMLNGNNSSLDFPIIPNNSGNHTNNYPLRYPQTQTKIPQINHEDFNNKLFQGNISSHINPNFVNQSKSNMMNNNIMNNFAAAGNIPNFYDNRTGNLPHFLPLNQNSQKNTFPNVFPPNQALNSPQQINNYHSKNLFPNQNMHSNPPQTSHNPMFPNENNSFFNSNPKAPFTANLNINKTLVPSQDFFHANPMNNNLKKSNMNLDPLQQKASVFNMESNSFIQPNVNFSESLNEKNNFNFVNQFSKNNESI